MDVDGPGTRAPLLGEALPVELMNTVWADRDGVHDALGGPEETLAWLRAVEPRLGARPSAVMAWLDDARPDGLDATARRLRDLRDALRRLAAETTGETRATATSAIGSREEALDVLDRSAAAAPTWTTLRWDPGGAPVRAEHTAAPAGPAVVSMLAAQAVELFAGDVRAQLRACEAPGCVLYFVKQHPRREWCSPGCGNRARVARHYRRHRPGAAG